MPKMKTKKAIKKRFKLTGRGKLMRAQQGRRHILTKKSSKRKRQLRRPEQVRVAFLGLYRRLAFHG